MTDPNLPLDHQDIDDESCSHLMDNFELDFETGLMECRICNRQRDEAEDPADFSGATEGDR